ncbi:hypothetical protein DCAR_0830893 [Daucus carota subsp. sativus]|uniref:Nuclear transcription factor Y subunit n=1 Tax=Daucus carota subsp. sativus TaxID=79200 RepID=A0AAF1BBW3_DAUCS|nr:hypothetical protein DCAR_0830893 [Daucus carota subsp. sativus]
MPHIPFTTTTSWWNPQGQQFFQPLSKSLSLKVGSPREASEEGNNGSETGHHPQDLDSSSTQSHSTTDQSHQEVHIPYAYGDPYVNGLYTAYGPQVTPQVVGVPPVRVPLPIELADDGPIYVNAKQYNGIMRRRQVRAKLEAQNKLLKSRKPYLHESRHRHAVNRVRGTGGRFLSKSEQSNPAHPFNHNLGSRPVNQAETGKGETSKDSSSSIMCVDNNNESSFQHPNLMYMSSNTGRGFMYEGTPQRSSPVVR